MPGAGVLVAFHSDNINGEDYFAFALLNGAVRAVYLVLSSPKAP